MEMEVRITKWCCTDLSNVPVWKLMTKNRKVSAGEGEDSRRYENQVY